MRSPSLAAVLALAACRPSAAVRPSDGAPTVTSAGAPAARISKDRMRDHDAHGAAIRDAIMRADLDAARAAARSLAELGAGDDVAPAWRRDLDAMSISAARLAGAKDLPAASRELGDVARSCGDCHAMLGGPLAALGEPPAQASAVVPRMQRHGWAVARLWDGLVVPSDASWRAGARVLADAPLEPDLIANESRPRLDALARDVHALGERARVARSALDRGEVYGELMATCAACHEWLGSGPGAP